MDTPIPFIDLAAQRRRLGDRIDKAIDRVLTHGKFIMGPEVQTLESELANFCGAKHAISCSSGTDALLLPLMAWGVGPGQAVFVPTFTFAATAEVVSLLGATPFFVDVDPDTFNMDPSDLQQAVRTAGEAGLRPAAVIPVDLFGQPADYGHIGEIAGDLGIPVLADGAQSFGAEATGKRVGTHAMATATSFFPAKPLGCYGDGGAVFTDNDDLADIMRSLRVHGQGSDKYDNVRVGINGRIDTIQAAVLLEKLTIFDDEIFSRQSIASRYTHLLNDVVRTPTVATGRTSAWAQFTITTDRRDELARHLSAAGIPTAIYYPKCLHEQIAYSSGSGAQRSLATSVKLAGSVLSLPMHPYLEVEQQERIADTLVRFFS